MIAMTRQITVNRNTSPISLRYMISKRSWVVLASVAMLTACSGKPQGPQGPPPAMNVKVDAIGAQPITDSSEYVSMLKSRDSANISPQVEGSITQIYVHSGEHVNAGTPLMQIDPI